MVNINIKEKAVKNWPSQIHRKQLVEAIGNDEKTVFSLTFDQAGMEKNLKSRDKNFPDCLTIDALFHTINENTEDFEEEIEFWEDYRDESVIYT